MASIHDRRAGPAFLGSSCQLSGSPWLCYVRPMGPEPATAYSIKVDSSLRLLFSATPESKLLVMVRPQQEVELVGIDISMFPPNYNSPIPNLRSTPDPVHTERNQQGQDRLRTRLAALLGETPKFLASAGCFMATVTRHELQRMAEWPEIEAVVAPENLTRASAAR